MRKVWKDCCSLSSSLKWSFHLRRLPWGSFLSNLGEKISQIKKVHTFAAQGQFPPFHWNFLQQFSFKKPLAKHWAPVCIHPCAPKFALIQSIKDYKRRCKQLQNLIFEVALKRLEFFGGGWVSVSNYFSFICPLSLGQRNIIITKTRWQYSLWVFPLSFAILNLSSLFLCKFTSVNFCTLLPFCKYGKNIEDKNA